MANRGKTDFRIETEVGVINLSIFEEGQAPKFRLISNEIKLEETMFTVETKRDNNETQKFLIIKEIFCAEDKVEDVNFLPPKGAFTA